MEKELGKFSPFLYCLWFIWTHASSGLKCLEALCLYGLRSNFHWGRETAGLACARALWPLPRGAHFCSRLLKKQKKEISQ